jgi:hypothetical protein
MGVRTSGNVSYLKENSNPQLPHNSHYLSPHFSFPQQVSINIYVHPHLAYDIHHQMHYNHFYPQPFSFPFAMFLFQKHLTFSIFCELSNRLFHTNSRKLEK